MSCTRLSCKCVFIKTRHMWVLHRGFEEAYYSAANDWKSRGRHRFSIICASWYFSWFECRASLYQASLIRRSFFAVHNLPMFAFNSTKTHLELNSCFYETCNCSLLNFSEQSGDPQSTALLLLIVRDCAKIIGGWKGSLTLCYTHSKKQDPPQSHSYFLSTFNGNHKTHLYDPLIQLFSIINTTREGCNKI